MERISPDLVGKLACEHVDAVDMLSAELQRFERVYAPRTLATAALSEVVEEGS